MKTYPLFKVHVDTEDALARVKEVFESGFINEGTQVTQLTNELREFLGAPNLVLTNSCTSALTMALKLAGVGPGDEVVSTPMTCVATNTPIINLDAKLVWADVDPRHGMINPYDIMNRITEKTKAVIAVAWAGTPPNLFFLQKLCRGLDVKLILDAAHAFGAQYRGVPMHEFADFTCFSFQAIKHFTTGDGGALVCHSDEDFKRSKAMKWFGLDRDRAKDEKGDWKGQQWDVDIEEAGYKFNMNNVSAAIGLSQLKHIDKILIVHVHNRLQYDVAFKGFGDVQGFEAVYPVAHPLGAQSSAWVYTMLVDPEKSRLTRDELLKALNAEGIMAGVVHVPNDEYTCFKDSKVDLPGVREFSAHQFSLPCGWWLEPADIEHIARRVKELTQ